jgi:tetratricopeptide (TPR) repeat protein
MTAMFTPKNHLLCEFQIFRRTVSLLVAGSAIGAPLLAQSTGGINADTLSLCRVGLAVANGQQPVVQNDQAEAMGEYQKMLQANPRSSLANYRVADLLFNQRNYQASANHYRDALRGDGDPRWTRVWSHLQLGKIFDITNQRDRAVNEYRLALQTNDNTRGALTEAEQLLQEPYKRPDAP